MLHIKTIPSIYGNGKQMKECDNTFKKLISPEWPWPWSNDLDTQTWSRYGQDVPPYQKWSFYAKAFKSYSLNRQTDRHTHTQAHRQTDGQYENITFPHTRAVIKNLKSCVCVKEHDLYFYTETVWWTVRCK